MWLNYPNGINKKHTNHEITFGNRGMCLESDLNSTNDYYASLDKAYIYKKPTPIKITKVNYPSRDKAVITQAFFTVPSTTDYNGIYKGKYIDFEAKETKNKTSFSLRNIHPHQIKHLRNIYNHGGIAFLIIRFTDLNETYLLMANKLVEFIENNTRESIPITYFRDNAYLIKDSYAPRIDYLKIIDQIIGGL